MACFKIDKAVAALPAVLEADTVYAVRVGTGFDLFVSDLTGTVAHPINNRHQIQNSGRMQCYTNNRWITDSDDNYGPSRDVWNENCGAGNNPLIEWEHMGHMLLPGTTIRSFTLAGKSNSNQVDDIEVIGVTRTPNPVTRWQTGMDNDGEDTVTDLFRGLWRTDGDFTLTGNTNDFMSQTWSLNNTVNDVSMLSIYMRPIGNITSNRYFRCTYAWGLEI